MTTGTLEDAEKACRISLETFQEEPVLVNFGGDSKAEDLLRRLPKMKQVKIVWHSISGNPRPGRKWNLC